MTFISQWFMKLKCNCREMSQLAVGELIRRFMGLPVGYRSIGYIPSNYVKEKELLGLQKYE